MRGFFLTSEELTKFHELGLTHFQQALYVHLRGLADDTGTVYQSLAIIADGMGVKGRQGSAPEPCSRQQVERAVVRLESVGLASKVLGKIFLPLAEKAETLNSAPDMEICQKDGKKPEKKAGKVKTAPDKGFHEKAEKKAETMSETSKHTPDKEFLVKAEAMSEKKAEKSHVGGNEGQEKCETTKPTPDKGLSQKPENNEDEMYNLTETINQLVMLKVNKGASIDELLPFVEDEAQKIADFLTAKPYMTESDTDLAKQYYRFWVLMGKRLSDIRTIAGKIEARKDPAKDDSIVPVYFNACFSNDEKQAKTMSQPKRRGFVA